MPNFFFAQNITSYVWTHAWSIIEVNIQNFLHEWVVNRETNLMSLLNS